MGSCSVTVVAVNIVCVCVCVCVPETMSLTSTQILISKCHPHSQEPGVFEGMSGARRVKMNLKNLLGYRKRYSRNDEDLP